MAENHVWHDWNPLECILKVAFVHDAGISVFTYRLCPDCGVTMEESALGDGWVCVICGNVKVEET